MTGTAKRPVTGRGQQPCSGPPKRRGAAYDRRPGAGPGRTTRSARPRVPSTERVRVILPDEPPRLTPAAAQALLRILLKAQAMAADQDQAKEDQT
jgi:hypothetical protein